MNTQCKEVGKRNCFGELNSKGEKNCFGEGYTIRHWQKAEW
jgi:hypothetical protein